MLEITVRVMDILEEGNIMIIVYSVVKICTESFESYNLLSDRMGCD